MVKLFVQPTKEFIGLILFKLWWFIQLPFSLGELLVKVSPQHQRKPGMFVPERLFTVDFY